MPTQFLTLSDDMVLDFLNTSSSDDTHSHEHLASDQHVIDWMRAHRLIGTRKLPPFAEGALVNTAHALREAIRKALSERKAGEKVHVGSLNAFLTQGHYRLTLVRQSNGQMRLMHEYEHSTPEQFLAQIAGAAAELLAAGDFALIRKCESDTCSLWFYDRTKAHRRRWCSMARCGNRRKVAAYRARRKGRAGAGIA
ncbi:ABATE domain-containing protein [Paraburkholderia sp. SARCC-3016]|uniref:CGNR zinc finger domain-containing protein n=1 Tax=Paraburkholderia sp. SARCC-3016 TaxID=3058611 RepID=UPI002807FE9B|nr:ABATE domain-containing protein [Paraburkholderia sp. SARCC-3016]MDQ7980580.1 ABATE domain-containing protein [Paraburkholderia sp. SARCC-3016]